MVEFDHWFEWVCYRRISFDGIGKEPVRAWEIGQEDDPMKRLVMYCL